MTGIIRNLNALFHIKTAERFLKLVDRTEKQKVERQDKNVVSVRYLTVIMNLLHTIYEGGSI